MKKRVIDNRVKEKFMMDDLYLNGQAKICGWQATLVYLSLCRHANKGQESFPSIKLMAEELDIGRSTVIKGLSNLEKYNVIGIKKNRGKSGKWLNNVYILIDKSEWTNYPVIQDNTTSQVRDADTAPSLHHDITVSATQHHQVYDADTKETQIQGNTDKETNLQPEAASTQFGPKQIVKIMDSFKANDLSVLPIDFGNKSERAAVNRLLSSVGSERLAGDIIALAARRREQFCPVVTKPTELERKYSQVRIFLEKKLNTPSIGKSDVPTALIIDPHKYNDLNK